MQFLRRALSTRVDLRPDCLGECWASTRSDLAQVVISPKPDGMPDAEFHQVALGARKAPTPGGLSSVGAGAIGAEFPWRRTRRRDHPFRGHRPEIEPVRKPKEGRCLQAEGR